MPIDQKEVQNAVNDALKNAVGDLVKAQVEAALEPHTSKYDDLMDRMTEQRKQIEMDTDHSLEPQQKGIGAARIMRAMAFAKNADAGADGAKWFVKQMVESGGKGHGQWNDKLGHQIQKVLQAGDFEAGGFLVPPAFANEIIEFLRARSVVRAAGPRRIDMPTGSLTIRRQTGTSTSTYEGESGAGSQTSPDPTGGSLTMSSKKLKSLVPISNDLLQFSSGPTADAWVRDDMVEQMATREDKAFLRDDGSGRKPKGMRFWAGNTKAQSATTLAGIRTDTADLIGFLEDNDVPLENLYWFMSPRSRRYLAYEIVDADGRLVWQDEINAGSWQGYRLASTNNIPNNLGGGSNESEIMLASMSQVVIADVMNLTITVATEASYTDPVSSNQVSAFERDETLMRAITKHDLAVRHANAVSVLTGVTYGV